MVRRTVAHCQRVVRRTVAHCQRVDRRVVGDVHVPGGVDGRKKDVLRMCKKNGGGIILESQSRDGNSGRGFGERKGWCWFFNRNEVVFCP